MIEQRIHLNKDPAWLHWVAGALGGMAYLLLIAILGGQS